MDPRDYIRRCLESSDSTRSRGDRMAAAFLAWSAGWDEGRCRWLLEDLRGRGRDAFHAAVESMRREWTDGAARVAFWIPADALFTSKLLPLVRATARDARFRAVSVFTGGIDLDRMEGLDAFLGIPCLLALDPEWLVELDFLQVMVGTEERIDSSGFPRHIRRVVQPHSIHTPLQATILYCAAGIVYDHVLCPSLKPEAVGSLPLDGYLDLYPEEVAEHGSDAILAIPAGYPKYDELRDAVRRSRNAATAIAYHVSLWELEEPFVHRNAAKIVSRLLEAFPERVVILRPMPRDLANPEVAALVDTFRSHPRFRLSTSNSYVDDYVDAAILVHHRSTTADLFSMATGRPVLRIAPDEELEGAVEHGIAPGETLLRGLDRLDSAVARLLAGTGSGAGDSPSRGESFFANPGTSTEYILASLQAIARGETGGAWLRIPLRSGSLQGRRQERMLRCAMNAFERGLPSRIVARAIAREWPGSWTANFLAAACMKGDGHPGFDATHMRMWLEVLECLARCAKLEVDSPLGRTLEREHEEWTGRHLPELVASLLGHYRSGRDPAGCARLDAALAALPLHPDLTREMHRRSVSPREPRRAAIGRIVELAERMQSAARRIPRTERARG